MRQANLLPTEQLWKCLVPATLGSLASVAGKFAFDGSQRLRVAELLCLFSQSSYCLSVANYLVLLTFTIAMLALNSTMLSFLVKAMAALGSVTATASVSSAGFVVSGFLGYVLFGEPVNLQWWFGVGCICLGVWIMLLEPQENVDKKSE